MRLDGSVLGNLGATVRPNVINMGPIRVPSKERSAIGVVDS